MAIKIRKVGFIEPNNTWGNVKQSFSSWKDVAELQDWNELANYYEPPVIVQVGEPITIVVTAEDVSWGTIKNDFQTWGDVKNSFSNWNGVKNYT